MAASHNFKNVLAAVGIGTVAYVVLQRFKKPPITQDGPIRVKDGSVWIENDDFEWEKDDADEDNAFHYQGRPNRWKVWVFKNKAVCVDGIEARRVVLDIGREGPFNDGKVTFKPNGGVRVIDEENRFVASGKTLVDTSTGARVKKVVVQKLDGGKVECKYEASDTCEVELHPLR